MPFSPLHLFVLVIILSLLVAMIQIGLLTIAFEKLGLSANSGLLLLFSSLLGSLINLPVGRMQTQAPGTPTAPQWPGLLRGSQRPFTGTTLVAVNVGGCIIPVFFSLYLIQHYALPWTEILLGIVVVSVVSYSFSRPVPNIGIAMPIFIAPLTAAIAALLINLDHSAPLAYICGTLGVLIGADLLRLPDIRNLGASVGSIGGAGTFDGIFMTGIVAVLLA